MPANKLEEQHGPSAGHGQTADLVDPGVMGERHGYADYGRRQQDLRLYPSLGSGRSPRVSTRSYFPALRRAFALTSIFIACSNPPAVVVQRADAFEVEFCAA